MKSILTIAMILFLSLGAQAQEKSYWDALFTTKKTSKEYTPKSDSFIDRMKHKLLVAKDKALEYYDGLGKKENAVSVAQQNQSEQGRQIASEEVKALSQELPSYKTDGLEQQTQEIANIKKQVSEAQLTSKVEGRKADESLKKAKSGVAVFDLFEKPKKGAKKGAMVKNIPVLDIGVEDQIMAQDFNFELPKAFTLQFEKIKELKSPTIFKESDLKSFYTLKFEKVLPEHKLEKIVLSLPKDITAEKVSAIALIIGQEIPVQELPFVMMTADEVRFLKGVILAEYKDKCHLSAGLLKSSTNVKEDEKLLKDYFYAACMHKMGFYTESIPALLKISEMNIKSYSKSAMSLILGDLKREYVPAAGATLEKLSVEHVNEADKDFFHYYKALARSMRQEYQGSLSEALKVSEKSEKYIEAQYMASVAEYFTGKVTESMARQERLLVETDKRGGKGFVKSLVKMNMGRAAYRNKQYKKAIEAYQFIGKENPLWIQALTEQGWMQILAGDAPGAVGNMHSVQIPQFKDIYKPESYAVRAIGYINICQYGDAKRTLDHLTKIYTPWVSAFKSELKKQQFNYVFYNNVIGALKGAENKTALPQPVVRELTRHKDFLNLQEAINNKVDEESQFSFISGLIKKDESSSRGRKTAAEGRSKGLQGKINSAGKTPGNTKFVSQWRTERDFESSTADYYDFEIETIKESYDGFKGLEKSARREVAESKENFKSAAGKTMKERLLAMQKKLEKLVENNEFLTYEILSGSGESIRYVAAGGQTKGTASTREVAAKENKGKMYLWDFDGEFWADEIGNYKSSLKDNCAKAGNLTQKVD